MKRGSRRARPSVCPPWEPTTDPNALTIENLERITVQRQVTGAQHEAIVADALAEDADVAARAVGIIVFAWPHLSETQRAHLLTFALTPEVQAAAAAQKPWG